MEENSIDAWIVMGREYNEDPVLATMLPATWMSARRRTILLFLDRGKQREAISRYDVGSFPSAWSPEHQPDQWEALISRLNEADPDSIAINTSRTHALADGASAGELRALNAVLPQHLMERMTSGERLALGWLETRTDDEMRHYVEACALAHEIIRRGFSTEAITPGETSSLDLEWWFREAVAAEGLTSWFQPTIQVQRFAGEAPTDFTARPEEIRIEAGDLLHVDFGLVSMGLHTDQQQMAYVPADGMTDPPSGLMAALSVGNRLQDLLTGNFVVGKSGNDILQATLRDARTEGIAGRIYTHPIGLHGHAAGTTIGLWDQQDGVPGAGDYPLRANTCFAIELAATVAVPEWNNQEVSIMLEEQAFFDGTTLRYLDGRQTSLHLVV